MSVRQPFGILYDDVLMNRLRTSSTAIAYADDPALVIEGNGAKKTMLFCKYILKLSKRMNEEEPP